MSLETPNLDDLRFQTSLVDEARKRIVRYCPEWTDYNVSDPGITLIELFAWMSELLAYRMNQVPEKNYISFLNLLGFQRLPASSARADLTFWLSTPLPISPDNLQDVLIPAGAEVRTDSGESEEVVFSTDHLLRITPPVLTYVMKAGQMNRNYLPRLGIEIFYPFNQQQPRPGDMFYLGFDNEKDISGHILQLNFSCDPTEAVGIRREDPPWVWECSMGDDQWRELAPSAFRDERDTTGGLNNPEGKIVFYLPLEAKHDVVYGRKGFWLRCRLEQRNPSQGMYAESPRVNSISAYALGATVPATHAQVVEQEYLGRSNGEPGQEFSLQHAPVLDLAEGETLLVEEFRDGEYLLTPWEIVSDFSRAAAYDRCFTLQSATGLVQLGPAVVQPDGSVRQYGRTPENGRALYFQRYRYGGGARGNLPPYTLQTMNSTIAYVARVANLQRASGGQDQESLEAVKLRAQRELKAQQRAVTAEDYEQFVRAYSRTVARVKCVTNAPAQAKESGVIRLLVTPAVASALQSGDLSQLRLKPEFIRGLSRYLDQYRLLTTTLDITEPKYIGVKVKAEIVINDYSNPEIVTGRVRRALMNLLNPLPPYPDDAEDMQFMEPGWVGWPLGRNLFAAEIYAIIQRLPGVRYVLNVEIAHRPVNPAQENTPAAADLELTPLDDKALWVEYDALLCSLDHEISHQLLSEYEAQKA